MYGVEEEERGDDCAGEEKVPVIGQRATQTKKSPCSGNSRSVALWLANYRVRQSFLKGPLILPYLIPLVPYNLLHHIRLHASMLYISTIYNSMLGITFV